MRRILSAFMNNICVDLKFRINDFVEMSLTFSIIERNIIERELRMKKNYENVVDGLAGKGRINKSMIKKKIIRQLVTEAVDNKAKRLGNFDVCKNVRGKK